MSADSPDDPARDLRASFDEAFSRPPHDGGSKGAAALAVRASGRALAVPAGGAGGLFRGVPITRLPSPYPELIGVSSFRDVLAPVYDLGHLLGGEPASSPAWLLLLHGPEPVALAFDSFEGQFGAEGGLAERPRGGPAPTPRTLLDPSGVHREVVDVGALRDRIRDLMRTRNEES